MKKTWSAVGLCGAVGRVLGVLGAVRMLSTERDVGEGVVVDVVLRRQLVNDLED